MKSLLLCLFLICFTANAQPDGVPFSPGVSNLNSPSAYYISPAPPGLISPLGDEDQLLDKSNTAPTPIPDDTSLILTPNNNSLRQSQEEDPFGLNKLFESEREDGGEAIKEDKGPNSFEPSLE